MVLLIKIAFNILETFPSNLWSQSVESKDRCCYVFDIVTSVKGFCDEKVRLKPIHFKSKFSCS